MKFKLIASVVLAVVLLVVYIVVSSNSGQQAQPQNPNSGYAIH